MRGQMGRSSQARGVSRGSSSGTAADLMPGPAARAGCALQCGSKASQLRMDALPCTRSLHGKDTFAACPVPRPIRCRAHTSPLFANPGHRSAVAPRTFVAAAHRPPAARNRGPRKLCTRYASPPFNLRRHRPTGPLVHKAAPPFTVLR
jgi:hypothetical protein